MWPLTAMGVVHLWTPLQSPIGDVKTVMPVSPSTPISWVPVMNQTMAADCPSVVVAMGEAGNPSEAFTTGTHQATWGRTGVPSGISTDMTTLPPPLGQPCAPPLV